MINRRYFIQRVGIVAAGAVVGQTVTEAQVSSSNKEPDLRIAHLTDMHVMADGTLGVNAETGFGKALEHAQNQSRKPDLILQGGDAIMDALRQGKTDVDAQWQAFRRALAQHNRTPIRHAIGNHDCWTGPGSEADESRGKAWALRELNLRKPYYSFDQGAWHFIVLDSTNLKTKDVHGYTAKLDDAQFKWLETDLRVTPTDKPVLILSHIPILAACAFMDGDNEQTGNWSVPGAWMHIDARRIKTLFTAHPNVKLCLSGHIHLRDTVTYNDVAYACNGPCAATGGAAITRKRDPVTPSWTCGTTARSKLNMFNTTLEFHARDTRTPF